MLRLAYVAKDVLSGEPISFIMQWPLDSITYIAWTVLLECQSSV